MSKVMPSVKAKDRVYMNKQQAATKPICLEYMRDQIQDFREFGLEYRETDDNYQWRIKIADICVGVLVAVALFGSIAIITFAILNNINMENKVKKIKLDIYRLNGINKFDSKRHPAVSQKPRGRRLIKQLVEPTNQSQIKRILLQQQLINDQRTPTKNSIPDGLDK